MSYYTTIEFIAVIKPEYRNDIRLVTQRKWDMVSTRAMAVFNHLGLPESRWGRIPFIGEWDEQNSIWKVDGDYNWLSPFLQRCLPELLSVISQQVLYYMTYEEDEQPPIFYRFGGEGEIFIAPRTSVDLRMELLPEYSEEIAQFLKRYSFDGEEAREDGCVLPIADFVAAHQPIFFENDKNFVKNNLLTMSFSLCSEDRYIEDLLDMLLLPAKKRIISFNRKVGEPKPAAPAELIATLNSGLPLNEILSKSTEYFD